VTNTTKAQIIVLANALMALVAAFGVTLSDRQTGAITLTVNAVLGLWVALTYRNSAKRVPDSQPKETP
jgi:hypothetical protein